MSALAHRGPLRAVILDWAGTTVDFGSRAPAGAFVEVFRRNGVPISAAEARGPMGTHKRLHLETLAREPAIAGRWKQAHGRPCSEADVERMYEEFVPLQLSCLRDHSALIPGTLEAVAEFRRRGLKIGTTTGYTREMIAIVAAEAKAQGFEPDATVCASDVREGRPAPWMALEAAHRLGVFPMEAIVKIGDTVADVEEGLNAGMWTIGLAMTGNELGLSEAEARALPREELAARLERARDRLSRAGAHDVVDGIGDCAAAIAGINAKLEREERP